MIIAAAGKAAHLAGVLAAHTTLPVIGIPIKSSTLDGLDALLPRFRCPRAFRWPPSPSTARTTPPCSPRRCSPLKTRTRRKAGRAEGRDEGRRGEKDQALQEK